MTDFIRLTVANALGENRILLVNCAEIVTVTTHISTTNTNETAVHLKTGKYLYICDTVDSVWKRLGKSGPVSCCDKECGS